MILPAAGLAFGLVSAMGSGAPECPIRSELVKQLKVLSSGIVKQIRTDLADPAQVSGITRTDFEEIQPWEVQRCGKLFCVQPKRQTLFHQILIRPKRLPDGAPNPRWLEPKDFPCSESLMKNFVTYECTIEHEKVHVVQREDAIEKECPAFVAALSTIKSASRKEAHELAIGAYKKLIAQVSTADDEVIPYEIEGKCQQQGAAREGLVCTRRPDWSQFSATRDLEKRELSEKGTDIAEFVEKGQVKYRAQFAPDGTKLESTESNGSCQKKEWYFAGPVLQQENCRRKDGTVQKTFYEYNKPQRVIELDASGRKKSEKALVNARDRITAD